MSPAEPVQPSIVPFFSIRFSPIEGVAIDTNMPKQMLAFELQKFVNMLLATSPPGEGMCPSPPQVMPG